MSALEKLAQAILDGRVALVAYDTDQRGDPESGFWIQVEPEPEVNAPWPEVQQ